MEEEIRELEDGEESNFYTESGFIEHTEKSLDNKITVDSNNFEHSIKDQPAVITYFDSGELESEWWYKHGREHRLTGPSWINYTHDNKINGKTYYIEGEELDKDDWSLRVNRILMLNELIK